MTAFGFTKEELRDLSELWHQCGLNTKVRRVKEMGDEMRDLKERVARIEHSLYGIEITRDICPKCKKFVPIMEIEGGATTHPTFRCLNCLQLLEHIDRYEIKKP